MAFIFRNARVSEINYVKNKIVFLKKTKVRVTIELLLLWFF